MATPQNRPCRRRAEWTGVTPVRKGGGPHLPRRNTLARPGVPIAFLKCCESSRGEKPDSVPWIRNIAKQQVTRTLHKFASKAGDDPCTGLSSTVGARGTTRQTFRTRLHPQRQGPIPLARSIPRPFPNRLSRSKPTRTSPRSKSRRPPRPAPPSACGPWPCTSTTLWRLGSPRRCASCAIPPNAVCEFHERYVWSLSRGATKHQLWSTL